VSSRSSARIAEVAPTPPAAARYSLNRPLPPDVVFRSASWFSAYRNYPVFSAPWFWRRTALFVPCAGLVGFGQSLLSWPLVDVRTSILFTSAVILIWTVMVTVGPALATIVRHKKLEPKRERVALVAAIVVGIVISFGAQFSAQALTKNFLMARAYAAGTVPKPKTPPPPPSRQMITGVLIWQAGLFFCLSGGIGLYAYSREQQRFDELQRERDIDRLRSQKSEVDLRLTVLQAQVEPHFLFNTLASVHSLIRNDPERAEATVEALVDHLRATLPKLRSGVGSQHSTLAEQIEVCTSYLAVMKVRMGERLRYDVDVPQSLLSHPFPPLMLVSLVENAIKHGIEPSTDGGSITIRATEEREGDARNIVVSVIDRGVGLRPGLGDGMGLANLRAQLAAQFGARGQFSITGGMEGGTVATLVVPYVEAAS
jgi:two-component sensor histidine kinase